MTVIRLYPPLFEEGKHTEFLRLGRTLCASQSPRDNSIAVFATNAVYKPSPMSVLVLLMIAA